ncbi:uncharacterized protein LOC142590979 isoform X2 [Dermacentor variabilis]|uniref:uncharacterized protein LOC142590979 isoform X2 n=1 Tax=Dermacentor variabilis TaxID=34621 RepID=UPI003F5B06F0
MIERLIRICVALLFACGTCVTSSGMDDSPECIRAMKAVDACSEKFKGRLPRELFTEDGSELLRRKLSACLALYSPAKEPLYPCSSEVGVTITAHCIKAELFEMASIKNKYRILVLVDEFVECMAQELGHPLAILRSAVEGTR